MSTKKSNINTNEPSGRLEEHGKYRGLARVAMEIADEWSRQLDEIERLLDAGEKDAAIAAMRKLIGRKRPVGRETDGTGKRKEIA
jgi:hypothetical protein